MNMYLFASPKQPGAITAMKKLPFKLIADLLSIAVVGFTFGVATTAFAQTDEVIG